MKTTLASLKIIDFPNEQFSRVELMIPVLETYNEESKTFVLSTPFLSIVAIGKTFQEAKMNFDDGIRGHLDFILRPENIHFFNKQIRTFGWEKVDSSIKRGVSEFNSQINVPENFNLIQTPYSQDIIC